MTVFGSRFDQDSPAYCELNYQKVCADAIFNRDWLVQAKSIDIRKSYGTIYDPVYCQLNGWLSPALKALQHDFDGMKLKAEEFCSSQDPSDSSVFQVLLSKKKLGMLDCAKIRFWMVFGWVVPPPSNSHHIFSRGSL